MMDFSQNYSTTTTQGEVQSAFFAQHQVGLYTAIAYVGQENPISFIILNDDISHGKDQVWFYERLIIDSVKKDFPHLTHVVFVSDGCAGQFKNKCSLKNLNYTTQDFGITAEWIFSPTSHGKSAADGVGGQMKRNVQRRVLAGNCEVYNARDFYNCAKSFAGKTRLFCVSQEEVSNFHTMLNQRWANCKTIPGTRSFHYFAPGIDNNSLVAAISARNPFLKTCKI